MTAQITDGFVVKLDPAGDVCGPARSAVLPPAIAWPAWASTQRAT